MNGRAIAQGFGLGLTRLRGRSFVMLAILCLALGVVAGVVERHHTAGGAADRALGSMMRLIVPLATFAALALATGRRRLDEGVWCLARHGASRRSLVIGLVAATAAGAALVTLVSVEAALLACYAGRAGAGWAADAVTSGWITALGTAAYAAWFGLGAALWRFGRGRWLVLGLDLVLGSGTGALAVLWPRAHLRSLIGGERVLELGQRHSSALLGALALGVLLLAALRTRD